MFSTSHHHHASYCLLCAENENRKLRVNRKIRQNKQSRNGNENLGDELKLKCLNGKLSSVQRASVRFSSFRILDECLMIQSAFCVV